MFRDRTDAARQLASRLKRRTLHDPLVLAIPRGGVATGAALAKEMGAELDVVLARKIPYPGQPEFALGAVGEGGQVYLNPDAQEFVPQFHAYLTAECHRQLAEIDHRRAMFRAARPPAAVAGRTVIVADDGLATGSTMIAALQAVRPLGPRELIAAVPVAPPDRLLAIRRYCDDVVCLLTPPDFRAVGQFYRNFDPVEDEQAVALLGRAASPAAAHA